MEFVQDNIAKFGGDPEKVSVSKAAHNDIMTTLFLKSPPGYGRWPGELIRTASDTRFVLFLVSWRRKR